MVKRIWSSLCSIYLMLMFIAIGSLLIANGFKAWNDYTYDWEAVEIIRERPDSNLTNIYNRIIIHTGRANEIPPLYMIGNTWSAWVPNAMATERGIYFTYAELSYAKNDDELALIMAHEMSHVLLGHISHPYLPFSALQEAQADQLGAFLMMRAGYDVCKGRLYWLRYRETEGDEIVGSHPNGSTRFHQLKMPWCKGELE